MARSTGVKGLGIRVWGLGFRGFRVWGLGVLWGRVRNMEISGAWGLGLRLKVLEVGFVVWLCLKPKQNKPFRNR